MDDESRGAGPSAITNSISASARSAERSCSARISSPRRRFTRSGGDAARSCGDELEDGNGATGAGRAVAVRGERREHAVSQPPKARARCFVIDDLRTERLAAEQDIGICASVVKPGRIVGAAGL